MTDYKRAMNSDELFQYAKTLSEAAAGRLDEPPEVCCCRCGWEGKTSQLDSAMTGNWRGGSIEYAVCPNCGSDNLEFNP